MSQKIFIYLFKCWNNKRIRIKWRKDQLRHIRVFMTSQTTGFIRFLWNSYEMLTLNNENRIRKYRAQASTSVIFLHKLYCNKMLSLLNFQGCRRLRSMLPWKKYTLKSSVFFVKIYDILHFSAILANSFGYIYARNSCNFMFLVMANIYLQYHPIFK